MQDEAAAGLLELKTAAADKLKTTEDELAVAAEERDAAHKLTDQLKQEAAETALATQAHEVRADSVPIFRTYIHYICVM